MKHEISDLSRRRFLGGAAGTALLESCSRTSPEVMEPARVSIVRAPGYDADLLSVIRELIVDHDLEVRNKRVVLKPNLVEFDPGTPINTNPIFVEAVLEAFRSLGAAEVRIAEGPGHRRGTLDMADQAGYFQSIPGFESIFTDLNLDAVTEVPLKVRHSKIASLYLPNTVLGCDLLVSLPKLKTHHWVGATLSMKNLFGLVPGGSMAGRKTICTGTESMSRSPICTARRRRNSQSSMESWGWRATGRFRAHPRAQGCLSPARTRSRWTARAAGLWESTPIKSTT
jgi:hypothetical protein